VFESKPCGKKKIEEGNVMLLFPGVWHRYMPEREIGWKEHWISFNGQQPVTFMEHGLFSPEKAVLDIGLNEEIINLYQRIMELIESEKIGYKEMISALTYQIMAQIHTVEKSKKFRGKETETLVHMAKVFMTDRIDQKICFDKMAWELGVGYSWFRRMFTHFTGLAPAQYFLQLKLNKSKELLVSTSLSVKEIALMTGFESQFYFSKFFKNRMGMSPIRFREYSRGKSQIIE
jgi:AraC-like DNA-binding protein